MNHDSYRVGNHQPRNLYRGDEYIGVMFDPADTVMIVEVLNNETFPAKPARTGTFQALEFEPSCLYWAGKFLGILFDPTDTALVAQALNEGVLR